MPEKLNSMLLPTATVETGQHLCLNGNLRSGVSVIIPVFNSEATLVPLVEQLAALFNKTAIAFEVILVNDASRDASWQRIAELCGNNANVRGINLMRNYGQHNAVLCGIRQANFDVIVTMDDDLQHPPEEVPTLLAKIAEGYDVVYGTPMELPHGIFRNLASLITKIALTSAMGAKTARYISAFRAFRTPLRTAFESYRSPHVSIDVLLTWASTQFTHVKVRHEPRRIGTSNYTLAKLLTHAVNLLTGFSTAPLRLASFIGFALTLFGIAVFAYVLIRYFLEGGSMPGFPFLASIIAIFSGAQLFGLGIIGEYLARLYFRLMDRPSYTVRDYLRPGGPTS